MRLGHQLSALLSLLQCQSATNVTTISIHKRIPGQIIVKSASDTEIPRPRINRSSRSAASLIKTRDHPVVSLVLAYTTELLCMCFTQSCLSDAASSPGLDMYIDLHS